MAKRIKVEVETACYVRAHGKEPRGSGHWMFSPTVPGLDLDWDALIRVSGTFTEAKKAATAVARERGITVLFVCS